jgi:hypothetical protein
LPAYGVAVEKEFDFRGNPERFTNIYHYRIDAAIQLDFENLADAVVARDRLVYTVGVNYKSVRVFGPTEGAASANLMRLVRDLSGGGSMSTAGASVYRELCAVVAIFVGRSPGFNRKVFVRKFIHLTGMRESGDSPTSGALGSGSRTFFADWMNGNKQVSSGTGQFSMVTPRNVLVPAAENAFTLPYARIRQLKQ